MDEKTIEKSVEKTEFVDKQLPTIYYENVEQSSISSAKSVILKVSDKTSEEALKTFRKVLEDTNARK